MTTKEVAEKIDANAVDNFPVGFFIKTPGYPLLYKHRKTEEFLSFLYE